MTSSDQASLPFSLANTAACRWPWFVVVWVLILAGLDYRLPIPDESASELVVEMASSAPSVAQAFFDTGSGYNDKESATAPVASSVVQTLAFPLSAGLVRAVRFDPITVSGTVRLQRLTVRRVHSGHELYSLPLKKVTDRNQVARLTYGSDGLEVVTIPDANDSQLSWLLDSPIDTRPVPSNRLMRWIGFDVSVTLLAALALGVGFFLWPRLAPALRPLARPILWLDGVFTRWAARLSRPDLVLVDRWVFWFYAVCALMFGSLAAAGINGSSLDEYNEKFPWSDVKTDPIAGKARSIRSDEWATQTPAILNQMFRRQPFPAKTSTVGRQDAALLFSVPCRDFTLIFRPQFWGFFLLPAAQAFSLYWQAKAFLLLTGVFSLLLMLTGGRVGLAITGALWMFFSAHIQWAYSWPSMLPEMIGAFGWTLCFVFYLCVGRNRYRLAAAVLAGVYCAVHFALCFYPPHQIPFFLCGIFLLGSWLWSHWTQAFRPDLRTRHFLALVGGATVLVAVLAVVGWEVRQGAAIAANTVYPGRRVSAGGGFPLITLISHFLDFWKGEFRIPSALGNICEGTGFLWLLPVTFLLWSQQLRGKAHLVACWLGAALLATWMLAPIPPWMGRWFLLDHVPTNRCLPALGLMNVVGVVLSLNRRPPEAVTPHAAATIEARIFPPCWPTVLAAWLGLAVLLGVTNTAFVGFFSTAEIVLTSLYLAGLIVCLLRNWLRGFAAGLLIPLVYTNALINPLEYGLGVVTDSALFRAVQHESRFREGRWLVYSHDLTLPGFVVSSGADVFNSFKVLPNLQGLAAFDPAGRYQSVYNMSGFTIVHPLPENEATRFEMQSEGVLLWFVSPFDPALAKVGVRYLVFDEQPPEAVAKRFRRVAAEVPYVWIYEIL